MRQAVQLAMGLVAVISSMRAAMATTIQPLNFSEQVTQATLVVEGTVVEQQVVANGVLQPARSAAQKLAVPPQAEPARPAASDAGAALPAPEGVGVEGGRMLFTEITLAVDQVIAGSAGERITFRVAGGTLDGQTAVVHGLPSFEVGNRYLLFFRPGFDTAGDPIVGVNQGFFQISRDDTTGAEILLNAESDIVTGIENDRVAVRRNPARKTGPEPQLGPAPVPDTGTVVGAGTSPEAARYWLSQEPPMSLDDFTAAVRAARGR